MNSTITSIAGIEVGHYTDLSNGTGCTVILCKNGATGGVDVRGGSPGTRETDLLRPMRRVTEVHGVVLSGGSAYGLDAATGVVEYLAGQGIGVKVGPTVVPIVSSAILFDLGVGNSEVRPNAANGMSACESASVSPVIQGTVGAGTGATVGKALGIDSAMKGGIGSSCLTLPDGTSVGSIVAVNSWGGVIDHKKGHIVAGPLSGDPKRPTDTLELLLKADPILGDDVLSNTTIGLVATDATLTKEEANFLAQVSHDGLALSINPCHTIRDGDTMFSMATAEKAVSYDITSLCAAAVEVTGQAVLNAVHSATGLFGFPPASEF
ncbi:MAG: peptidase S58 family protein [SAR202 cluster bacterium]|nr:MAG: peptidase S58 family protein [SAR202 cluster bacterium]